MNKTVKKTIIITSIVLASIIGALILTFLGYLIYLSCQYYRIEDNLALEITNNQSEETLISLNETYSIATYNIGFGAYSQDFDFFMDTGEMLDGTKTSGSSSRAKDEETVLFNTNGAIDTITSLNADFIFFQEVDTSSHRSYFVNQYEMMQESFEGYSSIFASNFHSGYLFYPFTNPIGTINSGIATFSKYYISSSVRRSFPVDEGFFQRFFDLDRCFVINRLPIEGSDKELVLINLHMSAYDEGGKIRALQLAMLFEIMEEEYAKGNYVIAGGDWNHDITRNENLDYFPSQQKIPDWVAQLSEDDLPEGFSFVSDTNVPTCRASDIPYTLDEDGNLINYTIVIDGFIVSANVNVEPGAVRNIDTQFMYSDHNPVYMQFTLISD